MLPSFTTSKPPTIPQSFSADNSYTRVLRTGKMENLSLDSPKVVGTATLVAGTVNVTIPGIESTDMVFVSLHSINSSPVIAAQYLSTFYPAVGLTPAYVKIDSYAANSSAATTDVSVVKYMVVKPI